MKDVPFVVSSVEGGWVELQEIDSNSTYTGVTWKDEWGPMPSVGTLFYVYTKGLGHFNEGIKRWDKTWLKTPEDYEQDRIKADAERKRKDRKRYEKNKDKWAADIEALEPRLRDRMNRFIAEKGGAEAFYMDFGDYELFCVTQADGLYRVWQKTGEDATWFDQWFDAKFENLQKVYPEVNDGHSGNTWGAMISLARALARGDTV